MLSFDEAGARSVEQSYATLDVAAQRAATLAWLDLRPGEQVLDVGSGPGYLLAEMADAVGPTGTVVGVDPSEAMNALARARCADRPRVSVLAGDALDLPAGPFDAAVSTQVYEYVTELPAALTALYQVVRPGGRVLILDTDWDTTVWAVTDLERQRRVLAAWEAHLADPRLPRRLGPLLRAAGFGDVVVRVIPILNTEYDADTYSGTTLRTIASYVAGQGPISAGEAAAWRDDVRGGDYFFSLNRYAFLATR